MTTALTTPLSELGIESPFKSRYDNFIGGKWVPPVKGEYFENISPITGHPFLRSCAFDRRRH
jgi:hypothetical protein